MHISLKAAYVYDLSPSLVPEDTLIALETTKDGVCITDLSKITLNFH